MAHLVCVRPTCPFSSTFLFPGLPSVTKLRLMMSCDLMTDITTWSSRSSQCASAQCPVSVALKPNPIKREEREKQTVQKYNDTNCLCASKRKACQLQF